MARGYVKSIKGVKGNGEKLPKFKNLDDAQDVADQVGNFNLRDFRSAVGRSSIRRWPICDWWWCRGNQKPEARIRRGARGPHAVAHLRPEAGKLRAKASGARDGGRTIVAGERIPRRMTFSV